MPYSLTLAGELGEFQLRSCSQQQPWCIYIYSLGLLQEETNVMPSEKDTKSSLGTGVMRTLDPQVLVNLSSTSTL